MSTISLQGICILIIEHDLTWSNTLKDWLETLGASVIASEGFAAGYETLQTVKGISLIICRYGLLDGSGPRLITLWRRIEIERGIPLIPAILMTAFSPIEVDVEVLSEQFQGFLFKPFSSETLITEVSRVLHQ